MSSTAPSTKDVLRRFMEVSAKLDDYLARQETTASEAKEIYLAKLHQLQNERRDLTSKLEEIEQRENDLEESISRDTAEANHVDSHLAELRMKEQELKEERSALEKKVAELRAKVQETSQEYFKLRDTQDRQGELDLPEMVLYEQLLGLKFTGIQDGVLGMVFTNIDVKEPSKEFKIVLDVSDHMYKVKSTQPEIPAEELSVLLAELNENRNTTTFFKQVRQAFKKL